MKRERKLTPRESHRMANEYIQRRRREAEAAGVEYRAAIRWHDGEYIVEE